MGERRLVVAHCLVEPAGTGTGRTGCAIQRARGRRRLCSLSAGPSGRRRRQVRRRGRYGGPGPGGGEDRRHWRREAGRERQARRVAAGGDGLGGCRARLARAAAEELELELGEVRELLRGAVLLGQVFLACRGGASALVSSLGKRRTARDGAYSDGCWSPDAEEAVPVGAAGAFLRLEPRIAADVCAGDDDV